MPPLRMPSAVKTEDQWGIGLVEMEEASYTRV
jgi:hypothetical protein